MTAKPKTEAIVPAIKWHGGKQKLAKWIIEQMPPRNKKPNAPTDNDWLHYVEPFAGGLGVLLALDPTGISEVVNDKNIALTNFWRVLSIPSAFEAFHRRMQVTPFSQLLYNVCELAKAINHVGDGTPEENSVSAAVSFFILCRQSMSGRMDSFAPITRNRCRSGMNEQVSAWLNAVDGLPAVHARLKRVLILNDDAMKVIRKQDGARTLFYLDPPYLCETRTAKDVYDHEMNAGQHEALLNQLAGIKGKFILSGYRSKLYDDMAKACGWRSVEKEVDNKSATGDEKQRRVEVLWMNY